jgi:hypothetical protein
MIKIKTIICNAVTVAKIMTIIIIISISISNVLVLFILVITILYNFFKFIYNTNYYHLFIY